MWLPLLRALVALLGPELALIALRLLGLKEDISKTAQESRPGIIEDFTYDGFLDGRRILSDLVTVNGKLDTIIAALPGLDTATLAAIAALPAGSAIPSASDTAAGVWNAIDPFRFPGDIPYGQELFQAAEWASLVRWGGSVPAKWAPFFNISYPPPAPD